MNPSARPGARTADEALDGALARLHGAGVVLALLRDPSRDGRGVLEADLLVDPDQRPLLEAVLVASGFRRRPGWGRDPHRFFIRPVPTGDGTGTDWLKLDVVTDLCFGPRHQWPTGLGGEVLRDVSAGPRPRLVPADELVAHLLHALLDRGEIRPGDAAALGRLAAVVDEPGRLGRALTEPGVGPASFAGLLVAVREARWDAVRAATPVLRRRVARRHPVRGAHRSASTKVLRRGTRVLRPLAGRGRVVALVGPDGTGKSTLVAGLVDGVGVPNRTLYGGTYRSGSGSTVPGLATARVAGRLLATRAALGWHRRLGRLVVLDRHPLEARPLATDAVRLKPRLRRTALAATLPCPDLLLVLDAPADVLHGRRPEHDVAHLERDRERHLALRLPTPTVVVDATADPGAVRARAVEEIWRHAVPTGVRSPLTEAHAG